MPSQLDLAALFAMGLFGSAHCLGMCGGFSLIAGRAGWWPAYALGKTVTYTVLGLIAGLLGHGFMALAGPQRVLSILVGLTLIGIGASTAGLLPDRWAIGGWVTSRLGPLLGRAMKGGRKLGTLGLGLLNGLLPCGLVYAALAKSVEIPGIGASALGMAVFGIATLPGLWLLGLIGDRFPGQRLTMVRIGGWLLVVLGGVTLWRAWMMGGH